MTDERDEAAIDERKRALRDEMHRLLLDPTAKRYAYWLSFAGDEGFRGGVLIDDCVTFYHAWLKSHHLRLNPGGELRGYPIDPEDVPADFPRNTLLSKDDLDRLGGFVKWPNE